MDRFIKQLAVLGFEGIDTFFFSLPQFDAMFGSLAKFENFMRERGVQKIVNVFFAKPNATPGFAFHERRDQSDPTSWRLTRPSADSRFWIVMTWTTCSPRRSAYAATA